MRHLIQTPNGSYVGLQNLGSPETRYLFHTQDVQDAQDFGSRHAALRFLQLRQIEGTVVEIDDSGYWPVEG